METPSSIRRITRSQATNNKCIPMSSIDSGKNEDSSTKTASRQTKVKIDRSALIDITNDSPIVGLAMGSIGTPSSLVKKKDQHPKQTPGSGEALLRGQVKILLQKVEEEGDISKTGGAGNSGGPLKGSLIYSPSGLLAPTPTNTPQVPDLSDTNIAFQVNQEPVEEEIHQEDEMVIEESEKSNLESERSDVTRALLFDFYEKSEISSDCSSVVTEGSVCRSDKLTEEDDASVWSIQVNASARDEDEEEEEEEDFQEEEVDENDEDGYGDFGDGGSVDELCEGLSNIFVQKKPVSFEGKHTRFVYNSDGEIEDEVVISDNSTSPGVLRLNGMPTPKGKHLRFPEEEEEQV